MRIRSIKPEFWRSDDITSLAVEDRLLFIGLWSYVDDNGVGRDDLAAICADLFAQDMFANPRETSSRVRRGLERLHTDGLITRYTVAGRAYFHVSSWERHQKIDRPSKPRYPDPDQGEHLPLPEARETPSSPRNILAAGAVDQGAGEQGNRDQVSDRSLALIDPVDPEPTVEEAFAEWWGHVRRKVSKPAAEAAFAKALKKIGGRRSDATRLLVEAITEHQRHWFDLAGRSIDKTPYPATWLNDHAWTDELPPDDAYRARATQTASETPTEKIQRMRQAAGFTPTNLNGGAANGYEGSLPRPAIGSRVS